MNDWKEEEDLLEGEEFTLESILAEFKGNAYIAGDRKTPKTDLDKKADRIVEEAESETTTKERQNRPSPTGTVAGASSPPQAPPVSRHEIQSAPREGSTAPPNHRTITDEEPVDFTPNGMPQRVFRLKLSEEQEPPTSKTSAPIRKKKRPETDTPDEAPLQDEVKATEEAPPQNKTGLQDRTPISNETPQQDAPPHKDETKKTNKKMRFRLPKETDFTPSTFDISDNQPNSSPYSKYASYDAVEQEDPAGYDERDYDLDDELNGSEGFFRGFLTRISEARYQRRRNRALRAEEAMDENEAPTEEGDYDREELEPDAMSLPVATIHYAKGLNALHLRGIICILLGLVMAWMCLAYENGFPFPGSLPEHPMTLVAVLLCIQLVTMFAGLEVISLGVADLFRFKPGPETLVMLTNVIIAIDAALIMTKGNISTGLPYCAAGAFATSFSLFGLKMVKNAMRITLKTASSASAPYIVSGKFGPLEDGYVLMKSRGETEGFLRKCQQVDYSEHTFGIFTPFLIIVAVILAAFVTIGSDKSGSFLHSLAVLLTASSSFSGLICYGLPFQALAKKLSAAGAALAGWGGACDVDDAAGTIITDFDVFPVGTVSISGVRVFQKSTAEIVLAYTGSIIAESGSGLSGVFVDVMEKHKCKLQPVQDFACYEGGGIGATIDGKEIIIGSSNFMNLMGIRLPQNLNVKYAVFTAIGGKLAGVFSINYVPINSVQEALVTMLRSKLQPLFAIRDFNVSPLMLQQKFKISTDSIDFLTFEERYAISALAPDERSKPAAVLCREGLGPMTDIVSGGRRLKQAVRNNVVFSLTGSLLGLMIMFFLCWTGGYQAASPTNLLIYLLAWLVPVAILSGSVKYN